MAAGREGLEEPLEHYERPFDTSVLSADDVDPVPLIAVI